MENAFGVTGRGALVIGGSRGIGRASAEALAREGARVAIAARGEEALRRAAGSLGAHPVALDLTSGASIRDGVGRARATLGTVDILVLSGGGPPPGDFDSLDDGAFEEAHRLLVLAAWRVFRETVPAMRARGWGRVVTIQSVSVREPIPDLLLSNVYRAGVAALVKSIARTAARDGVLLNTIATGMTATERLEDLLASRARAAGTTEEAVLREMASGLPVGRLLAPEEIGALALWLCSERNRAVTGATIPADGGALRGLW